MANYRNLEKALEAGTTNMTCHRNNVGQDDGYDTITGPSWFHFNGTAVAAVYASGNSWLGFGANAEQLKVNRRDCKMYYLYSETGFIGPVQFFKIRWIGYSQYNNTGDSYMQQFDAFLFDCGQIYLNFYDVPTSNCNGTNALVCGSETKSYTVTAGTPVEYTFTASDTERGTGWTIETGRPQLTVYHKPYGTAVFTISEISAVTNCASSVLSWEDDVPGNTALTVSAKLNNGKYLPCVNGGRVPCLQEGGDFSGSTLYIRVELATEQETETPTFYGFHLVVRDVSDLNVIVLHLAPGNQNSIQNAAGDITVGYSGGTLMGRGGPVLDFSKSFTPEDLTFKGNQNDEEHIDISNLSVDVDLIHIYYTDSKCDEHISLTGLSAAAILTNVKDL